MALVAVSLVGVVFASALLAPWVAEGVARRHYPSLARCGDMGFWSALGASIKAFAQAGLLLLLSLPLWVIPLVHLVVPTLVVGWLNARVMSLDVLSGFASRAEIRQLQQTQSRSLWLMGILAGWLGVAPAITWASGVVFVALFFVLMPLAVMIYLLVVVFTALWFSHHLFQRLSQMRSSGEYQSVEYWLPAVNR